MFVDGDIIGGYSYPNAYVSGAFSSLDGESLEELTGLNFLNGLKNGSINILNRKMNKIK